MNNAIPDEVLRRLLSLRSKFLRDDESNSADIRDIFLKYLAKRKQALADSLIASANLSLHIFEGDPDPLALKAIRMTNPNFDPNMIGDYSEDQLMGIINSAKGKYFELLVADKLNNGEQVGELVLPEGYHAELAESLTQPGWDLAILDPYGNVAEHLQLKATENFGYITEALEKYPDIRIIAADEAADSAPEGYTMVINSDIPDSEITSQIESTINIDNSGFIDKFSDAFHPLIPLAIIAGVEGYRLYTRKQNLKQAIKNGSERLGRSLFSTATGAMVFAVGGGILALPAAFTAGMLYRRLNNMRKVSEMMRLHISQIQNIIKFQISKRRSRNGIF